MKHEHFWTLCAAASATALVLGGAATAALAQQQDTTIVGERAVEEGLSVTVPYRDLNLATARDERILHYRVKGAAGSVCAPNDDQRINRPFSKCVAFALNRALPQVDLAVRRAREIAATGTSSIPLVAIAIVGR